MTARELIEQLQALEPAALDAPVELDTPLGVFSVSSAYYYETDAEVPTTYIEGA